MKKTAWEIAQEHEPLHWLENKEKVSNLKYQERISKRAIRINELLCLNNIETLSGLELGGGATPLIDFLKFKEKYNLDPLANFYKEKFHFLNERGVEYIQGKMEELPFDDKKFDIIICRNAIDHVDNIEKSLFEINRVLKDNGKFYLAINTFGGIIFLWKYIFKDKEHPYTFSNFTFRLTVKKVFKINKEINNDVELAHFNEMESQSKVKTFLRNFLIKIKNYQWIELILIKK